MALKLLLFLCALAMVGCGLSSPHTHITAEQGAKPATTRDGSGYSSLEGNLLFQAEQANDVQGAEKLLKSGADPYQKFAGQNLIDYAAADGHLTLVHLLIHHMPQLSHPKAKAYLQQAKNVALDSAVTSGTVKEVNVLLAEGSGVNNFDGDVAGEVGSPLMRATARGSLNLMRLLLRRGANANRQDDRGRTALMYVGVLDMYYSSYNNEERDDEVPAARLTASPARLLIQHGADITLRDHQGKTALMWAAQGNPQAVSLLLAHGARVDARDKSGRTALLCAASVRDLSSMGRLLAAGADVDAQDKEGETPLMRASVRPEAPAGTAYPLVCRRAVSLLLRQGANPRLKDKQHRTVTDYAKMNDEDFISAS